MLGGRAAAAVGAHPHAMMDAFRRQYGCSIGTYQTRLRLAAAARQLSLSDEPIVAIALFVALARSHNFTQFNKHFNTSPGRYRRQHQSISSH